MESVLSSINQGNCLYLNSLPFVFSPVSNPSIVVVIVIKRIINCISNMELGNGVNQDINDETKLCNHDKDHPTNLLDNFSPEKNCKETQNSNLSQNSLQQPQLQPDLNLRLSLGSVYGENYIENPLTRRSSIAGIVTLTNNEAERSFLSLSRARSLPTVVAEQEQRLIIRRELQTVRRIEAKNRLIEKQRSFKEARQKEKFPVLKPKPALSSEVAAWAAASAANSPALCRAIHKIKVQGLSRSKRGVEGSAPPDAPSTFRAGVEGSAPPNEPSRSQAVVEGSATHIAPSRIQAGVEDSAAPNAPSSFKVSPVVKNAEAVVTSATTSNGICVKSAETKPTNPYKKARTYCGNFEDIGMDVMRQMPTVSTTGEGPNGRRIEGFLYTYTRGHVCIVCVCHGSFLSPAEFVKHAGGNDVPNPMKHITVYSTFA